MGNRYTDTWTDERLERVKQLWADGLSAGQIADQLGIISRSSVLGKVHRLGLQRRAGAIWRDPDAGQPRKTKAHPRPSVSHGEPIALTIGKTRLYPAPPGGNESTDLRPDQSEHPLTIMELENCHCRWPLAGEPSISMLFCADPTADLVNGRPYCGRHAAITRQPGGWRRPDQTDRMKRMYGRRGRAFTDQSDEAA